MLLHEIITKNDELTSAINTEEFYKYRKSLLTYYRDFFTSEPVLLVFSVFNACSYALICPACECQEAMESYFDDIPTPEEAEVIFSQSIMLSDFAK